MFFVIICDFNVKPYRIAGTVSCDVQAAPYIVKNLLWMYGCEDAARALASKLISKLGDHQYFCFM